MKPVKFFYQPRCPHCLRAMEAMDALLAREPYARLSVERIDELAEPELADRYDYYYVPTFYVGDSKAHEGAIRPEEVEAVLRRALGEE